MKVVDRIFAVLLMLSGAAHTFGSVQAYRWPATELVWALSATLAVEMLGGINLLRTGRPHDRALAWICLAACLGWLALVIAFGVSIGNVTDFRVLIFLVITLVLSAFSLRSAIASRT